MHENRAKVREESNLPGTKSDSCNEKETTMLWIAALIVVIGLIAVVINAVRAKRKREFLENTLDAEALFALMNQTPVQLYDVRQPLDLLAYSEMIPGAKRIPPKELIANPELIPRDQDVVVYCTCEAQKTSLEIVRKAKGLGYSRVKVLRDGLAGWKAQGYPVAPYRESFRLDTAV
jgi:rhodanese-related sulfurtransferase